MGFGGRMCKTGKLELVDVISKQCPLKTKGPCLNTHTHTHAHTHTPTLAEEAHTRICVFNVNVIIFKDCLESF